MQAGSGWRVPVLGLVMAAAIGAVLLSGCDPCDEEGDCGFQPDLRAPAPPRGISTVTGDHEVWLYWVENGERDLDGYRIYRNDAPTGYFDRIATVGADATGYVDRSVRNGRTYYYALAAFDYAGNESDLSYEEIHDTPRPEGFDLRIDNAARRPERAGYDFSERRILDYRDLDADLYYWYTADEGCWMVATERSDDAYSDIQDAGFLALDDLDWAPDGGWSPSGDVPLIPGHVYAVWTWDNHFAKFRVLDLTPARVVLDWAYQIDPGNPELSSPASPSGGPDEPTGDRPAPPKVRLRRHSANGGERTHRVGLEGRRP